MPTLLLEIGCEELPARACRDAKQQLPALVERGLDPVRALDEVDDPVQLSRRIAPAVGERLDDRAAARLRVRLDPRVAQHLRVPRCVRDLDVAADDAQPGGCTS